MSRETKAFILRHSDPISNRFALTFQLVVEAASGAAVAAALSKQVLSYLFLKIKLNIM